MAIPRPRKNFDEPIPNESFSSPEVHSLKGPYWDMPIGPGLEFDPYGSVQTAGSTPSNPTNLLYGPNGFVGVGTGLEIDAEGNFVTTGGNVYCSPAYPDLPPSNPPYGCNTEVNTAGVTDFTNAWSGCDQLTEFPCVDASSVIYFGGNDNQWWGSGAWSYCSGLISFPLLDTSSALSFEFAWSYCYGLTEFPPLNTSHVYNFTYAWSYCYGLTSFPEIDTSSAERLRGTWASCTSLGVFPVLNTSSVSDFAGAWYNCSSLTSFPFLDVSSGKDFYGAWQKCTSLTTFPAGMFDNCSASPNYFVTFWNTWYNCALSEQSVDNILVSLDASGILNSRVDLNGGTSAAPGAAGAAAKASLQGKGWIVITN